MKKTISLMLAFIAVYLGAMYFVKAKYNYDWTPATPEISEEIIDMAVQDSVIGQGILPADNKNYLNQYLTKKHEREEAAKQKAELLAAQKAEAAARRAKQRAIPLKEQLAKANLVDIETLPVKIFLDMRYATQNNFTGQKLYNSAKCYLKRPVAKALQQAAAYALEGDEPFYLCIYDCYRPKSVQKFMLENATKPGYLSSVSNHSRGMAVDLGPCDAQGEALLTPTEFDTFSEFSAAYTYNEDIPQIAIKNRTALQNVMKRAGFKTISNEWWHFDYPGAKNQEVFDIKF